MRRQQPPVVERLGLCASPRHRGRGQRFAHRQFPRRLPERREHPERPALPGRHGPRLEQQIGLEAPGVDAVTAKPLLQPRIDLSPCGVAPVPVHGARAGLGHQRRDHLLRGTRSQHHRRIGGQLHQGTVQPPARSTTERPDASAHLIAYIHQHHRLTALRGRRERRVVRDAQVIAEPHDRGGHQPPVLSRSLSESRVRVSSSSCASAEPTTRWMCSECTTATLRNKS